MATPSSSSSSPTIKCRNDDHNLSLSQNKERAKKTSPPLPSLPDELIIEILSRSPAKSLIQFRCVSKSFKSLISDPQFIKTHLEKVKTLSKSNHPDFSQKIVISSSEPLFKLKSCSLHSVYNNPETDAVLLDDYSLKETYRYDWVVGSCDGLLCLGIKQDFVVLWNPTTRVFNRLPDLGFSKKLGSYTLFGFGYDSRVDDYKVLAMFCFQAKIMQGGIRYVTRVKVCALKVKHWRRVDDFRYGIPYDVSGKHVNGNLCWPVITGGGSMESTWSIFAFNLAEETFKDVGQPAYGEGVYDRVLGVLQEWLCVMCNFRGVRADVWVMKEYGVGDSWTKMFSIPYLDDPLWFHYSVPLCIFAGGEVMLEYKSVFVIYNPKDGSFRYLRMNGASSCLEADVYIQSLVSPMA